MEQRENKERKNNVSFSILSHLFHISVSSILSLLSISPRSFPSLSLISLHVLDHLTLLAAHPAPSLFSFSLIPVLSLLVPTSASRHHFLSFLYTRISSVTHLSYSLFYLSSLGSLGRVFVPLALLRTAPCSFCSHSFHFPFSIFLVHLPFHSPYLCTFSRRVVFSSLLLLKFFLQFLLSLIPSKPFPVYLYLPLSYFHHFSFIREIREVAREESL
jgi:hypothetical protein